MTTFHQILVSNELGGAGLMALYLANFLQSQSHQSHVWIPGAGPAQRKAEELGLQHHFYTSNKFFSRSPIPQLTANCKIGYWLSRYRPGIMHIYSPFYYRVLRLASKISRFKSIVHIQLEEDEDGLRWAFKDPPDLIITCADFLVPYVRRTLPERYQQRQFIVSVPNAVDTDRFFPGDKTAAKLRVGAPASIPLALMVANLAPHKGQETAVRALAALNRGGVKITLWLAGVERGGEHRYTAHLRSLATELGVGDQVKFLGQREDTPDLLRAADLFLLPSKREGLPLSILEAQATKVPVLAAPTPGIEEVVIDEKTGFLIFADDVEGYAQRIQHFLHNTDLYRHIAEQAYAKVISAYTFQAYCRKVSHLYEGLLNPDESGVACCSRFGDGQSQWK